MSNIFEEYDLHSLHTKKVRMNRFSGLVLIY